MGRPPQCCHLLAKQDYAGCSHRPAYLVPNMSEGLITPLSGQLAQQPAPSVQPCGDCRVQAEGVWWGASPAFSSQLMPRPSVLRTCQWETVLTHQIMAERKLLQGGDILRWQYGDVKCALWGGEEGSRGGSDPWKGTNYSSIDMRKYTDRRVDINILTHVHFPVRTRTREAICPALKDVVVRTESNFSFSPAAETRRFFKFYRSNVSHIRNKKSNRRGRLVLCWCFQFAFASVIKTNYSAASLKQVRGEHRSEGPESTWRGGVENTSACRWHPHTWF